MKAGAKILARFLSAFGPRSHSAHPVALGAFGRPHAQIDRHFRHFVWTGDLHAAPHVSHVFIWHHRCGDSQTIYQRRADPASVGQDDVVARKRKFPVAGREGDLQVRRRLLDRNGVHRGHRLEAPAVCHHLVADDDIADRHVASARPDPGRRVGQTVIRHLPEHPPDQRPIRRPQRRPDLIPGLARVGVHRRPGRLGDLPLLLRLAARDVHREPGRECLLPGDLRLQHARRLHRDLGRPPERLHRSRGCLRPGRVDGGVHLEREAQRRGVDGGRAGLRGVRLPGARVVALQRLLDGVERVDGREEPDQHGVPQRGDGRPC